MRLQQVIRLHHDEERTLREIGSALGVTESRISQLLTAVVKKLRTTLKIEVADKPASAKARRNA